MTHDNHFVRQNPYQKLLYLFLIFPIALFVQIVLLPQMPQKYFYDSRDIYYMMIGKMLHGSTSYMFSAKLFRYLNYFFNFQDLQSWSYLFAFIFNLFLFAFLFKYTNLAIKKILFIYCTVALLNIYVFRISKDIFQFIIFIIAYQFLSAKNIPKNFKVLWLVLLFVVESLAFRIYYLLVAALFLMIYLILCRYMKGKQKLRSAILIYATLLVLGLYVLQFVSYDNYIELTTVRDHLTINRQDSTDAVTNIVNLVDTNGSILIFITDYVINLFRVFLPFELLGKGIKYIPFIIFQLYITCSLWKNMRNIKTMCESGEGEKYILEFCIIFAYYLVAAVFEPDFGSFVRHESSLCPILFDFFLNNYNEIKNESGPQKALKSKYIL